MHYYYLDKFLSIMCHNPQRLSGHGSTTILNAMGKSGVATTH